MRLRIETYPSRYVNDKFPDHPNPYSRVVSVTTGRWLSRRKSQISEYPPKDKNLLEVYRFDVPSEFGKRIRSFFGDYCTTKVTNRYWNCHIFSAWAKDAQILAKNDARERGLRVMRAKQPAVDGELQTGSIVVFGKNLEPGEELKPNDLYHSAIAVDGKTMIQILAEHGYMRLSTFAETKREFDLEEGVEGKIATYVEN